MNKDIRSLIAKAEKQGCQVKRTRGSHIRVSRDGKSVTLASTTSHSRTISNARADLKRVLGLDL